MASLWKWKWSWQLNKQPKRLKKNLKKIQAKYITLASEVTDVQPCLENETLNHGLWTGWKTNLLNGPV